MDINSKRKFFSEMEYRSQETEFSQVLNSGLRILTSHSTGLARIELHAN